MPLFPPPEKQGEIAFVIAKSMPYRLRMAVVAAALLSGLAVQLLFSFWTGLPLLVLASLMGMVRGYDAKPVTGIEVKWERVTPDEYRKVREKADALKNWDTDAFDGTNTTGVMILFLTAGACAIVYLAASVRLGLPDGFWIFPAIDAAALLLPLWLTGVREYLRKDRLLIKIKLLENTMRFLEAPSDVQVFPMLGLQSAGGGKNVPSDARLMVKLLGAPEEFMGLQVQVSINSVKGTDFPYLYCVLIAKKDSGFLDGYGAFKAETEGGLAGGISALLGLASSYGPVYEPSPSPEVDVLVIRQRAGRNGGYSTSPEQAWNIVSAALKAARGLSAQKGGTQAAAGAN
jgi:hypothetical protein